MKRKRLWKSVIATMLTAAITLGGLPSMAVAFAPERVGSPSILRETSIFTGNLAIGKTAYVSAVESAATHLTGDLAIDGDNNTRWSGGAMKNGTAADQTQTPQWITVDLETTTSTVTSIEILFYRLVWGQKYQIQTSATNDSNAVWENLDSKELEPDGSRMGPTDTFTFTGGKEVKRFIRVYFEKVNTLAGGNAVSVAELTINGSQEKIEGAEPASAPQALSAISNMTLSASDTTLPLPSYQNFDITVKGSEVKNVVSLDGTVTAYNIGNRTIQVILKAQNKQDASDTAEKTINVTIPDKTSLHPQMFPAVSAPNTEPEVIPNLQEWYGYEGYFTLNSTSRILINDRQNVDLQKAAEIMQSDLLEFTGIRPAIVAVSDESTIGSSDIYIESIPEDTYLTGEEGYYLITDQKGIRIYSTTYTGCFYGTVTVEQILWQNADTLQVPKGVIRDFPNYEVRGVMLDIARTPYRLQLLKDYAKILSWYKLNEYQLHINDNVHLNSHFPTYESIKEGMGMHRLQSETFPSLKSVSKGTSDAAQYFENVHGDPLYTKDEWKTLQIESWDLGVNIITEIDTPSHAVTYSKYAQDNPDNIPWLGPIHNSRNYEQLDLIGENSERALRFIKTLWDEYTNPDDPTFLGDTVNIGMDEYWNITAAEKPAMANYIIALHDLMVANGKKVRMWGQMAQYLDNVVDDSVTAGLNDIELDVWYLSYENINKRISQGYKVVNIDEGWLYGNPLRDRRDVLNVEYLYENWTPVVFNGTTLKKAEPALLGAKTALWGDVNRKGVIERDLHARILPAVAILSEKTWGGVRETDTYEAYEFKYNRLKEGPGTTIAMNVPTKSALVAEYDAANLKDGTLYDASGNSYDASVSGGTVVTEDGVSYLKFDGNTTVTTPLKSLSYPYTVSFDLKLTGEDTNDKEASLFSGYDGRLQVAGQNGSMSLNRSFFQQSFDYTVPLNQNVEVTVVGTFQTTKLYINGKLHKVLLRTNRDEFDLTDITSSFVFPMENIGNGFQGRMGNIRFYNQAFAPGQIAGSADTNFVNVAQNTAAAGNSQRKGEGNFDNADKKIRVAWKAIDGDVNDTSGTYLGLTSEMDSYWKGGGHADDSLAVDLGEVRKIEKVIIRWEGNGYAQSFKLQVSDDGENWRDIETITGNSSVVSTVEFQPVSSQFIRMLGVTMNGSNSYAIREFEVYERVQKEELLGVVEQAEAVVQQKNLSFDTVSEDTRAFWDSYLFATALTSNPLAKQSELEQAQVTLQEEINRMESPAPTYSVTFQGGEQATGTQPAALSGKEGETITLPANPFTKEGFTFKGWNYNGTTYQPEATFTMPGSDVEFTATWEAVIVETTYTATFQGGGQTTGTAPEVLSAREGDSITLPDNTFVKSGSTFKGWTYGGRTYQPGESFPMPGENVEFVASWETASVPTPGPAPVVPVVPVVPVPDDGEEETPTPGATVPAKVEELVPQKQTQKAIKLSWNQADNATSYIVEQYQTDTKEWKQLETVEPTTYKVGKLKAGTVYQFRVRGCRTSGTEVIEGPNSEVLTIATAPKRPTLTVKKLKNNKIKLTWAKGTKAAAYNVYIRTGKGAYEKLNKKAIKGLTFTTKSLEGGKKYFLSVRGYKSGGSYKSFSAFALPQKVTL